VILAKDFIIAKNIHLEIQVKLRLKLAFREMKQVNNAAATNTNTDILSAYLTSSRNQKKNTYPIRRFGMCIWFIQSKALSSIPIS